MRALADGRVLGVFPEGRISLAGALLPFQTGVALMALRSSAPVYPASIEGTMRGQEVLDSFLYPHTGAIAFGPAVPFDTSDTSRHAIDIYTLRVQQAVAHLANRYHSPPPGLFKTPAPFHFSQDFL
jgi:1-acyl-sn-glycerol-3-phosphate acyltransferase